MADLLHLLVRRGSDGRAEQYQNVSMNSTDARYLPDLVNGVFRAMLDSSQQQMQMYVQLLNSVSASAAGFEQTRTWLQMTRPVTADEAYELMRVGAEESGGDLHSVASDVIDLGTSRLPR